MRQATIRHMMHATMAVLFCDSRLRDTKSQHHEGKQRRKEKTRKELSNGAPAKLLDRTAWLEVGGRRVPYADCIGQQHLARTGSVPVEMCYA